MNFGLKDVNSTGLGGGMETLHVLTDQVGEGGKTVHPIPLISVDLSLQIVWFTVLVSICSIFGTVGNILVLLVYVQRNDRRTANTFIRVLAVIDLVVCAIIMPYTIVYELHLVTSDLLCRAVELLRHVAITASNLTIVAVAVERYVAVCVIRHRLTVQNVNHGMIVVVVGSVVISLPSIAVFAVVSEEDVKGLPCSLPHQFSPNYTFCHFTLTIAGPVLSRSYQAGLMLIFFLSFVLILFFYALVYVSLWRRCRRRTRNCAKVDSDVSEMEKKESSVSFPEGIPDQKELFLQDLQGLLENVNQGTKCLMTERATRESTDKPFTSSPAGAPFGISVASGNRRQSQLYTRTARMLFLCSIVFLVTWLPFWVDIFGFTHNLCLRYLFFVGNASNPLIYGLANSHFRHSLMKVLSKYKPLWCMTFRNGVK